MTALPPPIAEKCAKALGQLSSPNEGQVMAGARGLVRILEGAGLGITDLMEHVASAPREVIRFVEAPRPAEPRPFDWGAWRGAYHRPSPTAGYRSRIARCQQAGNGMLSEWERGFLLSLTQQLARGRDLSPRQVEILSNIATKVGA